MILRSFSPPAQRVIAVSLLILLLMVMLLFILVPLGTGIAENLRLLDAQRSEQARAEAILALPLPRQGRILEADSWVHAPDGATAMRNLAALITGMGARRGVQVTMNAGAAPATGAPVLLTLPLTARGEQAALLAFIGDIEAGRPLLRFRQLSLQRQAQSSMPSAAPSSAIAPQSPNLTDAMTLESGSAPVAPADNAMDAPPPVTMVQADAVVMGLWGGN
jgi:hypothetical protein